MGYYTNYEIEIMSDIDWDDIQVHNALKNYNCQWLCLRDMEKMIVIFSIYSSCNIEDIIQILKSLYSVEMQYKVCQY